jgi:hypothetical protein
MSAGDELSAAKLHAAKDDTPPAPERNLRRVMESIGPFNR